MKNNKLVIIGVGEFAKIAYEYFENDSEYTVVAFAVDEKFITDSHLFNLPVINLRELETYFTPNDSFIFIAVTFTKMNSVRSNLYHNLKNRSYKFASYISSKASLASSAKIGENCFLYELSSIGPFVTVSDNVIICSGSHIAHSAQVEKNCYFAAGVVVGGFTSIGENCFLGLNATVGDKLRLHENTLLAAGSVLLVSSNEPNIYRGNPAKNMQISSKDYFELNGGVL